MVLDSAAMTAQQQHLYSLQKLIGKRLLRSPTTVLINNMGKLDTSKEEIKNDKGIVKAIEFRGADGKQRLSQEGSGFKKP